jgi:single-stranded-DNA-specific exonuclease
MEKRWTLKPRFEEKTAALYNELKIHPALCRMLVQRGADSFEKARQYFRPSLAMLHSPWLMKDMDKAVARICAAIDNQQKILVFGDYDVDGTTAVACLYKFLNGLSPHVDFYIPHRYREGYGVSLAGIEHARNAGFQLIIALDCGIKSVELVKLATTYGIDFIICDHHLPDRELPPAVAILNAKQADCNYPFKELCGCGVGLKLIQALCEKLALDHSNWQQLLDLVAVAIAADIVPMTDENRVLTYFGLQKVNQSPNTGIAALIELSNLPRPLHVNSLVFGIAPRINAAGRMDDARKAVQLFIETDLNEAKELAKALHSDNTDRREADLNITDEALALIENTADFSHRKTTVLFQQHWHKGVVGIVASRLIDKYYRPTIVLTQSGEKVSGSARSVIGFNVYEAIHQCKELLENYGGHFYAAGLTMKPENLDAFTEKFEAVVADTIEAHMLVPEVSIDVQIDFKDIQQKFFDIICQMEPYGPENLRPVFLTRYAYETGGSRIVKEDHIKFRLKHGAQIMDGIGFGLADKFHQLQPNQPVDIVYTLDENEWNGEKKIQLRVMDLRSSDQFADN